jgi:hypothetical protein
MVWPRATSPTRLDWAKFYNQAPPSSHHATVGQWEKPVLCLPSGTTDFNVKSWVGPLPASLAIDVNNEDGLPKASGLATVVVLAFLMGLMVDKMSTASAKKP